MARTSTELKFTMFVHPTSSRQAIQRSCKNQIFRREVHAAALAHAAEELLDGEQAMDQVADVAAGQLNLDGLRPDRFRKAAAQPFGVPF